MSLPLLSPSCLPFKGVSQTAYFHTTRSLGLARALFSFAFFVCLYGTQRNGSYSWRVFVGISLLWIISHSRILVFVFKAFQFFRKRLQHFPEELCVCGFFHTYRIFLFPLFVEKQESTLFDQKTKRTTRERKTNNKHQHVGCNFDRTCRCTCASDGETATIETHK